MKDLFHKIAVEVSSIIGSPAAFLLAIVAILVWAVTGPVFNFSDTWQLIINTGTTIVTFLIVFLIQNTQNRDAKAMQLKLDELIRSSSARNKMIDLEELSDNELDKLENDFRKFHEQHGSKVTQTMHQHIKEAKDTRQSLLHKLIDKH